MTDWKKMVGNVGNQQYSNRLKVLRGRGIDTKAIEETVEKTIENLIKNRGRSFVIFGEPQSGKTEMMIALNAKLLDEGTDVIINLVTDSVDLLEQSLSRFRESGLSPSPKQYTELPQKPDDFNHKKWVIFSKKNAKDLEKLKTLLQFRKQIVVIDDEADFASPNAKVNKNQKTRINQLIHDLLGTTGQYIGVTATPARLNLNNTFENDSELWVEFRPHPDYVGQKFFFPSNGVIDYRLHTFDVDEGSERNELENAILHFLCGVAEQHMRGFEKNFTMLVHTSGKKDEHNNDIGVIRNTIDTLSSPEKLSFEKIVNKKLKEIANEYSDKGPDEIVKFVLRNIYKNTIVEINSSKLSAKVSDIAKPKCLFSFAAGGNIISRGVTFDNLLSMYFTRSVKGKFSQDTYIQRARMFGNRKEYKNYFQLWCPTELMKNWSKCFEFHNLAISAMRSASGAPVWLSDHKTIPTSSNSIDKSTVDFEDGEMSFHLFKYNDNYDKAMDRGGRTNSQMLDILRKTFSEEEFPQYLYEYIKRDLSEDPKTDISFHKTSQFGKSNNKYSYDEIKNIRRKKGIFSNNEFSRSERPNAKHHLKIFFNKYGDARLFYKINGDAIKFIRNKK
ncbi:Z1 domain-containing protein [Bartonella choladocola]|uniref:Type III restriction enzyme, res subunit n=1 Tax=Bartonella choladocola TaxID=2750995 RepID=A0A1U9MJM0_9HYPH|nr:Z1 domain-containing protein [Bartonella choladocola]AQT48147.1 Type III restriction enzyme, res subunit [Bartonella choladocola]